MRAITTRRELIAPWLRMRRSLAQFSGSDDLCRMPWSAGCIINTSESKFSVHTGGWASKKLLLSGLSPRADARRPVGQLGPDLAAGPLFLEAILPLGPHG